MCLKRDFKCSHKKEKLSTAGPKRITTIIRYSKDYDDEIHSWLQTQLDSDSNYSVQCHRSCVSTYTSPLHRKRSLLGKRSAHDDSQLPQTSKCLRRSVECSFNFEKHCIFCSKECSLKRDYKNPNRWRPAYVVRQVESGKSGQTLTNLILAECDTRGPHDEWASKVRIRVQGAISDLHAADACYHVDCKRDFLYNQVGMTMLLQLMQQTTHSNQLSNWSNQTQRVYGTQLNCIKRTTKMVVIRCRGESCYHD